MLSRRGQRESSARIEKESEEEREGRDENREASGEEVGGGEEYKTVAVSAREQ